MELSSEVFMNLSFATLSSSFSIILKVVSTPMSDAIRASSILSRIESSTLDFPATALASRSKIPLLVFSRPSSNALFSSFDFEPNNPNSAIRIKLTYEDTNNAKLRQKRVALYAKKGRYN